MYIPVYIKRVPTQFSTLNSGFFQDLFSMFKVDDFRKWSDPSLQINVHCIQCSYISEWSLNRGKCITLLIKSKRENKTQFGTIPKSNIKIVDFISMGTKPALVVKWCVMQVLSMYDQMPILINNTWTPLL